MDIQNSYKPKALGIVIFFNRNESGTYSEIARTPPFGYLKALEVYANTPNPASQLVGGDTLKEVMSEANEMVKKMLDKDYVAEYVDPYV